MQIEGIDFALESTVSYHFHHAVTRHKPTDLISALPVHSSSQPTKYDLYHTDSTTTESITHCLFTDTPPSPAVLSARSVCSSFVAAAEFGIALVRTVVYYLGFRWRIRVYFVTLFVYLQFKAQVLFFGLARVDF